MKPLERILLPLLISIPVLFTGLVTLAPQPTPLLQAWDKVELYETNGQGERAVPYYHTILEFQPWRTDLYERIGANEFAGGNLAEAVTAYTVAKENQKISAKGMYNLGSAYLQSGEIEEAAHIWLELAALEDVDAGMLASITKQLRTAGELDGALSAALRWSVMDPKSTEAAWITGLLQVPDDPAAAVSYLSDASSGKGAEAAQAEQLLDVLHMALSEPNPAYQRVLIGQRLADMGQWDVAKAALEEAVRLDPEYAEAWALLGEVQQNLGEDGWKSLARAKSLNPESDVVLSAMALYWTRQEKYHVALEYLKTLAGRHPEEGRWQMEIGRTLAQSGDMLSAMNAYQRATEIEPKNSRNWLTLAVFSATYGFDSEAFSIPAITRALELAPDDPVVLDGAGWVYLTLDDLEKAEQFLQQAVKEDGTLGSAKLHLAQVYIETNRLSLALPLLKEAAAQATDSNTTMFAERLLQKFFPGQ